MTSRVWVIGARGLLGKSVRRAIATRSDWIELDVDPLPWGNAAEVGEAAGMAMRRLVAEAQSADESWSVLWVAGAAVTSSPPAALKRELAEFRAVLDAIAKVATASIATGSMFVASSAGGVYGGSADPPFTEQTSPVPLGGYGQLKLDIEGAARAFSGETGIPVLIGRITNLYGPGQRLDKLQGLISHLASSYLTQKPVMIFVPLDTVRDYFYVDDCADLIIRAMDRLAREPKGTPAITKILGSGQNVTIGSLLGYLRGISKRPPRLILGTTEATNQQALDLRMFSTVWRELDRTDKTPITAGFHATILDLARTLER